MSKDARVSADKAVATGGKKARKITSKSSATSKAGGRFRPQITVVEGGYTMKGFVGVPEEGMAATVMDRLPGVVQKVGNRTNASG
jgi:hypothetical protein